MKTPFAATQIGRASLSNESIKVQLLDNGRYQSLVSAAGTGQARWNGLAVTRWSADATVDQQGWLLFIRDLDSGAIWSAGHQPLGYSPDDYKVVLGSGQVCFTRSDHDIGFQLDIAVADDADVEQRRCVCTNRSERPRRIELTSYLEPVLQAAAADAAHPAFSKLFLQTAHDAQRDALIAWRRPRQPDDVFPVVAHWCVGHSGLLDYETDRVRFLGRGRGLNRSIALLSDQPLSGTTGNVLDPILCLRSELHLQPGESMALTFLLGVAETTEAVGRLVDRFSRPQQLEDTFSDQLAASTEPGPDLTVQDGFDQALLGAVLYDPPAHAAPLDIEAAALEHVGQRYGISAARAMVLAQATQQNEIGPVLQALRRRRDWRRSGLDFDLLMFVAEAAQVSPDYQSLLAEAHLQGVPVYDHDDSAASDLSALAALCALQLPDNSVRADLELTNAEVLRPSIEPPRPFLPGDFEDDGKAYVFGVNPGDGQWPPLPWSNIVSNGHFGFLVTESGATTSWAQNSRENRLTPWENDTVADPHGEAIYLRDEHTGDYWSPMPGPVSGPGEYRVTHGFGYTRFDYRRSDLVHETVVFAACHLPFKVVQVTLHNQGRQTREISATAYQQLVLGVSPTETRKCIVTSYDDALDALFAVNPANREFADCVAFAALLSSDRVSRTSYTTDRRAFLGRFGCATRPQTIRSGQVLRHATGAGLDPCFVLQSRCRIAPGQRWTGAWLLGEAESRDAACKILSELRTSPAPLDRIDLELQAARSRWQDLVGGVQIATPARELDLMFNGWLTYQNVSCRLWGRTAFYQSGGAYGFRDQLQDASALVYVDPKVTRAQILRHASHQFVEGDVLHWWHPPTSKGIRTRFSDDLLWLPYLVTFYIGTTGDRTILQEQAPFVDARQLEPGEDEVFLLPADSGTRGDIYEHCCRVLDRSLTVGSHGLPLMGTGDWNDGMNRVGREGRGESVWLGFFLHYVLEAFVPLVTERQDQARLRRYSEYLEGLREALNDAGWDGGWYRRAFYDDGAPMGSVQSDECRIDAIAQAWAVISGVAPKDRANSALDSMEQQLVDETAGIIRLLAPPFDKTKHDPGYIRGYLPGVRENGGQYTHGALWAVRALFEAGRHEKATRLLSMLSPLSHTDIDRYKVEPYVIAADVYGVEPHVGRGGWTWYTGSAGWMYRIILESLLGFRISQGDRLMLQPRIPQSWPGFVLSYRMPATSTRYRVEVSRDEAEQAPLSVFIDGRAASVEDGAAVVPLTDDGGEHEVRLLLGANGSGLNPGGDPDA